MQKIFTRTFRVRWSEIDSRGHVSVPNYLRYLVETAYDWGSAGQLGVQENKALGLTWVILCQFCRRSGCAIARQAGLVARSFEGRRYGAENAPLLHSTHFARRVESAVDAADILIVLAR